MKRFLPLALILVVPAALAARHRAVVPPPPLPAIGLMVPQSVHDLAGGATFLGSMHVTHYRPDTIYLDRTLNCGECKMAQSVPLQLVLTVEANGSSGVAATPPADIPAYKQQVANVIATFHPAVIIAGNEENSSLFYGGTPAQYHVELQALCSVAHTYGVPCTDGGLTSRAISALTVVDYLGSGQSDAALSLARRTLGIPNLTTVAQLQNALAAPSLAVEVQRAHDLFYGFAADGVDFFNFHFYEIDAGALQEVVAFIRRNNGGRPVITDEIGQRNEDPNEVTSKLQTIRQLGLPIAIWFSGDGPVSHALQNSDWSLRPNGVAFQQMMLTWPPAANP